MNEIDAHVRWMLLAYPTLYRNRFEAFAEMMTNSCYEWDAAGRLVHLFPDREDASPASMVAHYEEELARARRKEADNKAECLADLERRRVVEAERELVEARHIAENVDVYAAGYTAVSYRDVWAWLHYRDRHGVPTYGAITGPPENIAEDWRRAIREFLAQILPPMNSLMGMHTDAGWVAIPRYAPVFDWVMATYKRLESDEDRAHAARTAAIADDIVREILAEERPPADFSAAYRDLYEASDAQAD